MPLLIKVETKFVVDFTTFIESPTSYFGAKESHTGLVICGRDYQFDDEMNNFSMDKFAIDFRQFDGIMYYERNANDNSYVNSYNENSHKNCHSGRKYDFLVTDNQTLTGSNIINISDYVNYRKLEEMITDLRIKRHNLDKTQIKLLISYGMAHVLVDLDRYYNAQHQSIADPRIIKYKSLVELMKVELGKSDYF
jgi:hypothetical protein